jgi:opacity protein-like surface antigen
MTVLAVAALACAPAMAGDVAGFYAGVYGGGVVGSSAQSTLGADILGVWTNSNHPGPYGFEYNPDSTAFPAQLDKLKNVVEATPFADTIVDYEVLVTGTTTYARSALFGGVVGYGFGNGMRVELDFGHSASDADTFRVTGFTQSVAIGFIDEDTGVWTLGGSSISGSEPDDPVPFNQAMYGFGTARTTADFLLVNGWHDFDTGTKVTPYVGGGAGLARLSTALFLGDCDCDLTESVRAGYVPAAQIGAGFKVQLSGPLSLDLGYRLKLAAAPGGKASLKAADVDYLFEGSALTLDMAQTGIYTQHTLTAGLTYAFN